MQDQMLNRVVVDPDKLDGQAHIRNTHFTISDILYKLADGMSVHEILGQHPRLTELDVRAAVAYAAIMLDTRTTIDDSPLL